MLCGITVLGGFLDATGVRVLDCCNTTENNALPMSYLIDQRRLMFWQKTRCSNNVVLRTLSALKNNRPIFLGIGSKYGINSYDVTVKPFVWTAFERTLESMLL